MPMRCARRGACRVRRLICATQRRCDDRRREAAPERIMRPQHKAASGWVATPLTIALRRRHAQKMFTLHATPLFCSVPPATPRKSEQNNVVATITPAVAAQPPRRHHHLSLPPPRDLSHRQDAGPYRRQPTLRNIISRVAPNMQKDAHKHRR